MEAFFRKHGYRRPDRLYVHAMWGLIALCLIASGAGWYLLGGTLGIAAVGVALVGVVRGWRRSRRSTA